MMGRKSFLQIFLSVITTITIIMISPCRGQLSLPGCGVALQDVPNPSSDTCTSFYRCYKNRQFSLRCPLGQAFHFDRARCRPENEVDCPLQLQRFQAPAVPNHMLSPFAPHEREVEIRVVHLTPGTNANNLQFFSNGRQVPVSDPSIAQRGGQALLAAQQQRAAHTISVQQPAVVLASHDLQPQATQGQSLPGQSPQVQVLTGQSVQGLPSQGQVLLGPTFPGQAFQGQIGPAAPAPGNQVQAQGVQDFQGQTVQGFFLQPPVQVPAQG